MGFEPGLLDGRCRQNHRAMAAAPFFNFFGVPFSVTRLLYYYFNICPFRTMKFAQKFEIFAKVGSQFCQILNSYSRKGPKLVKVIPKWRNFVKSGHTGHTFVHRCVNAKSFTRRLERLRWSDISSADPFSDICPTSLDGNRPSFPVRSPLHFR